MRKSEFNLQVTINSFDDERHDITVQARDSDGITRLISSRAFDLTPMHEALKYMVYFDVIDKIVNLMDPNKKEA